MSIFIFSHRFEDLPRNVGTFSIVFNLPIFLNLWKNTHSVLNWFNELEKGRKSKFVQFDIESFYPSITKELLTKALEYAQSIVQIDKADLDIIHHSRKSLLFSGTDCWIKKNDDLFDVTMGAYDGAEVCEMVGLYLLKKTKDIIPQAFVGLYRDDGLAVVQNANGPNLDRIRKKLHKCFKEENLKIEVMINMSEVNFLDVNLNIATGKIKPFRKPNNSLQYIHAESNHPKNITKNLPAMIEKRLSGLSSNKEIFDEEKMPYEEALTLSGHNVPLKYTEPDTSSTSTTNKRKRRRKVMWYNPPYSKSVSTNIGREFLNIITRNFPPHHKYHKLFNRNNVKISYSCMPNMRTIIKGHNLGILNPPQIQNEKTCNCRKKENCPLDGKCLVESVVYEGTITCTENDTLKFKYIGLAEGAFKTRFHNHNTSFRDVKYSTSTELSKKYWEIKNDGKSPNVSWQILKTVGKYKNGQRTCNLCLTEKLFIIKCRDKHLLNSRSEISSKCRHKRKFLLSKV